MVTKQFLLSGMLALFVGAPLAACEVERDEGATEETGEGIEEGGEELGEEVEEGVGE